MCGPKVKKGILEVVVLLLTFSHHGLAASNPFTPPLELQNRDCIPAGDTVSFECVADDDPGTPISLTVWRGSAFNCPNEISSVDNRISLTHSEYSDSGGASGTCGSLMVQSGTVNDTCYPSTLTFNAAAELNDATVECTLAGSIVIGISTLQIGVTPGPSRIPVMPRDDVFSSTDTEFTISWDAPSNADMVVGGLNYSVDGGACGSMMVMNTYATFSGRQANSQTCSFEVTAVNGRCNFSSVPLVIDITFEVPAQPTITGVDVAVFQSGGREIYIFWDAVNATAFSVRSGGEELIDGNITNYIVTINGVDNIANCDDTQCSYNNDSFSASELSISVVAVNALGPGPPDDIVNGITIFEVTRNPNPDPTNVTLSCDNQPCQLSYGTSPTNLNMMGVPGVPLQNIAENALYYFEATLQQSGGINITVMGSFGTCECSVTQLGEDDSEAESECQALGYMGGVRLRNGIVCYTGTTEGSQAVFMCRDGGMFSAVLTVMCQCPTTGSPGTWGEELDSAECPTKDPPIGVIIGVILGVIAGIELVVAVVVLVIACVRGKDEEELSSSTKLLIALGVVLLFVFVGILVAIVMLVIWLFCCNSDSGPSGKKRKMKLNDEEHELKEPSPESHDPSALYSDPHTIAHETAPESQDQYAVLDTHTRKAKAEEHKQDPNTLQKAAGPEGDLYTVPEKPMRGSSKKRDPPPQPPPAAHHTEEELSEMYATPDKTRKNKNQPLIYTDVGMTSAGAAPPRTGQGVMYTTIAGTEQKPVEVPGSEPTYAN